ncbi:hypothetical protein, partial [Sphingomonas trueperi]|uniref:hypothetical protein n=1 Tax=Sphingomonas trueperi TaxID=53317 RepID=UPI003CD06008
VDPAKDSKAASESIKNRTKTRSYYIRQAGDDPEEVFEELAREEEMLREKGLLTAAGEASTDNPTDPDDDEDEARDAA